MENIGVHKSSHPSFFPPDANMGVLISLPLASLHSACSWNLSSLSTLTPAARLAALVSAHVAIVWHSTYLTAALGALHVTWIGLAFSSWRQGMPGRHRRDNPLCPSHQPLPLVKGRRNQALVRGEAWRNMDHLYVSFPQFLIGFYLLVPNAMLLWMGGSLRLVLRQQLLKLGLLKVMPCDYAATVANLCLNATEALHVTRIIDNHMAEFCWEDISYMGMDARCQTLASFRILIDLNNRRMVGATVDGEAVSASQALTLLWFHNAFSTHVQLHSMANWGIATRPVPDRQLAWLQTATVLYNFYGFTTFARTITRFLAATGLTARDYSDVRTALCRAAAVGVPSHGPLRELAAHSRFVHFMLRVRAKFLREFARHAADFPGADGEALFLGTVMHSLDHVMMGANLPEPLWLDVGDARFGATAELMRHVLVGIVPDLPGPLFRRRCRDMRHPLFRDVFEFAEEIDPWLAGQMDAGICK